MARLLRMGYKYHGPLRASGENVGSNYAADHRCGWCDKIALGSYDSAAIRLAELKGAVALQPLYKMPRSALHKAANVVSSPAESVSTAED